MSNSFLDSLSLDLNGDIIGQSVAGWGNDFAPEGGTNTFAPAIGSSRLFDEGVIWQESRGNQFDKHGRPLTSSAGAIGIAQVMPGTAPEAARYAGLAYDEQRYRNDPEYNAALGRAYFNKQLETFGNEAMALAAYNAGPGNVQRAIKKASASGNPDAWLSYLPAETRDYVPKILGRVQGGSGNYARPARSTPAPTNTNNRESGEGPDFLAQFSTEEILSMAQAGSDGLVASGQSTQAPVKKRTAGEAVADNLIGASAGIWGGIKSVSDAFGADNAVSGFADKTIKFLNSQQSDERKAERQSRQAAIKAAEDSGSTWSEIVANVGAFTDAPIETTLNVIGSSAPTLLASMIPGLGQANAARFILQGAVGTAQGVGAVKGSIYEKVQERLEQNGMSKSEAAKVAAGAQAYDSANAGQIALGGLLGFFAGSTGLEGAVGRMTSRAAGESITEAARGAVGRTALGVLKESPLEGVQGGQERVASNIALQNLGYDEPTFKGAIGQGVGEAIASIGPGAVGGYFDKPNPVAIAAQQPNSPLSRAAVAAGAGQPPAGAATSPQPTPVGPMVPSGTGPAPSDELAQRASRIETIIKGDGQSAGVMAQLVEQDDEVGMAMQGIIDLIETAKNSNADPQARETALAALEAGLMAGGVAVPGSQQAQTDAVPLPMATPLEQADAEPPLPTYMPGAEISTNREKPKSTRVLQPRKRDSQASIQQMHDNATNLDYLQVGPSSVMGFGAPIVFGDLPSNALLGDEQLVTDMNGKHIATRYAIVDAGDVIASNRVDGSPVREYETGAPGKLRAIVGNGRKESISHAYDIGAAQQRYLPPLLQNASKVGIDAQPQAMQAMKKPMLVRVMDEADITDNLGAVSNWKLGLEQPDSERAANDARDVDFDELSFDEQGQPTEDAVVRFIASLPSKNDTGNLMTHDGRIAPQAYQRLEAAAFKYAYEDDALVEQITMEPDPVARRVLDATKSAAGVMAALKGQGDFDLSLAVADAIKIAINAARKTKATGRTVTLAEEALNQDIDISDEGRMVAAFLGSSEIAGSSKRMGEALRRWGMLALREARTAEQNMRQGSLLPPATMTRAEIFASLGSDSNPVEGVIARRATAGAAEQKTQAQAHVTDSDAGATPAQQPEAQAQPTTQPTEDGLQLNAANKPFSSEGAAKLALRKFGQGRVVPVEGGFAIQMDGAMGEMVRGTTEYGFDVAGVQAMVPKPSQAQPEAAAVISDDELMAELGGALQQESQPSAEQIQVATESPQAPAQAATQPEERKAAIQAAAPPDKLPNGVRLETGTKGAAKGKLRYVDSAGDSLSNWQDTEADALKEAKDQMARRASNAEAEKRMEETVANLKAKALANERMTDRDLESIGIRPDGSEFSYMSPAIQRLLDIPRHKVREAMGNAVSVGQGMYGGEKEFVNPRKAIANAVQWLNQQSQAPNDLATPQDQAQPSIDTSPDAKWRNNWGEAKRTAESLGLPVKDGKRNLKLTEMVKAIEAAQAQQQVDQQTVTELETAAHEAATSEQNDHPEPTQAQKDAGNYRKGHIRLNGHDISIENPAGSQRNPEWPPLQNHYGYIKGTVGADKDHVDVFMTDNAHDPNLPVFVVDQVNKDGSFDEHKVVMGATNEVEARQTYLGNYEQGWTGLGAITQMSQDEFKAWVRDPKKTKQPLDKSLLNQGKAGEALSTLTNYTPEEIEAQQAQQEQAAKAEAARKSAEAIAATKDDDRKRIAQASVAAADSFELGQDPMDSLTGQGSLLDAPAQQNQTPVQTPPAQAVTDEELSQRGKLVADFVQAVISGSTHPNSIRVGPISADAGQRMATKTAVPVQGAVEIVIADSVIHANKRHPDLTLTDWARLPEVTNTFDDASLGKPGQNQNMTRIVVRKSTQEDGSGYGAVYDFAAGGSKGRKKLNLVTYFRGTEKSLNAWWEKNKGANPAAVPNYPEPASSARDDVLAPSADSLPPSPASGKPTNLKEGIAKARTKKVAEAEAQRAAYFAPGNIVGSYPHYDRVISYTPADSKGNWSVTVQAVEKRGGEWVNAPRSIVRTHSTQPDARELKAGPTLVAEAQQQAEAPKAETKPPEAINPDSAPLRAKAAGVRGVRAGMSSEALAKKVKAHLVGERAARYIAAGKKSGLPQYQGVSEDDARAFAGLIDANPYALDSTGATWALSARGMGDMQRFVSGGLLENGDTRYKHALTGIGKEIARQIASNPVGDVSIEKMLTEIELASAPSAAAPTQQRDAPKFSRASGTDTEAERQFKETERAYGGRAAYDRAKASGKTKLTYGQWVQVRTPNFKAWFGDWEVQASNNVVNQQIEQWASGELPANVILNIGHPSSVLTRHGVPNLPITLRQAILRKAVKDKHGVAATELKDIAQAVQAPIAIFDDPDNPGTRIAVTEIRHADGNIIAAIRLNIERDGLEINDIRSLHPKRDSSVLRWAEDGLLLGLDKSKGRDWLENLAATNSQQPQASFAALGQILYDADSVRNASKVVDPATGEPLAVHHGTADSFDVFDDSKDETKQDSGFLGRGFYFSTSSVTAGRYADMKNGEAAPNILPVYISLQNPLMVSMTRRDTKIGVIRNALGLPYTQANENITKEDAREVASKLREMGYDGVMLDYKAFKMAEIEVVALDPTQIKSTIGNNGNFDPANPDIRYSRQPSDDMFASTGGMGNFLSIMNAPRQGVADQVKQELVAGVRATVEAIRTTWSNAPDVEVAFDMNDPIIPQAARNADLQQRSRGATGDPEGFYFEGKVYLLASRLSKPEDAARVLLHESLGHYGLHGVFGQDLSKLLNQIATMRKAEVTAKAVAYGLYDKSKLQGIDPKQASPSQILATMSQQQRLEAAEEVLAEMAQDQPTLGFVQRAIAAIRTWLRNHVPMLDTMAMTDEEIINGFILPARGFVEHGSSLRGTPNAISTTSQNHSSTPNASVAAIHSALTDAYGNLFPELAKQGLVILTQTQEQAIEAAAQARAEVTGVSVEQAKAELMASVKKSAAMRLWVGSRTVNDAIIPETPQYAGSKTGDLAYVPAGAKVPSGSIRVAVGIARAAHQGFGIGHMADNVRLDARRAPPAATTDLAENLMRQTVAVLGNVSSIHRDGNAYVFASQRTKQAIVAKWTGAHYSVITVRPFTGDAVSRWGNPEWRGRLAFPPRADAETAPSTASHQVNNPQLERDGQEVVSEKFYLNDASPEKQPTAGHEKRHNLDIKRSSSGSVQGFFDPQTGQSFLIADNLSAETAPGVLMHEVGIHMAADSSLKPLFNRAELMLKAQKADPFMQAAQARLDAAGETSPEEVAAYLVEAYENQRAQAPASVKRWLQDLLAAVKAWLHRKGIVGTDSLTVADIAAVARANAKSMARGNGAGGVKFSRTGGIDQTQTENFKRWFGDSKVVDADGKPLVVYHGTNTSENGDAFKQFNTYASKYGLMGMGGYFTADPEVASSYTKKERGITPTVYPVYLSIQNPLDMDAEANPDMWRDQFPGVEEFLESGAKNENWYRAAEDLLADQDMPTWEGAEAMQEGLRSMGFDGITHIGGGRINANDAKHLVYIAFDPEQIKSAIGNNGNFDPANPDIRFSRTPQWQDAQGRAEPSPATWQSPETGRWDEAAYNIQDRHIDTKRVQQAIETNNGQLADDLNVRQREELFHGRNAKEIQDFQTKELNPMLEQLGKDGIELAAFEEYLHARHAPEANKVMAERNPNQAMINAGRAKSAQEISALAVKIAATTDKTQQRILKKAMNNAMAELNRWNKVVPYSGTEESRLMLSGMSDAQAKAIMDGLTTEQLAAMQRSAKMFDDIVTKNRELMVGYELESQDTVDSWANLFQHYVPLMREEPEGLHNGLGTGEGFSIKGREVKSRTGSTRKVVDIVANLAMQREKTITRGEKNRVTMTLMSLAEANPNPDFWKIGAPDKVQKYDPSTRTVKWVTDPLYKSRENVAVGKRLNADGQVEEMAITFNKDDPRALRMAQAIKNLDDASLNKLLQTLAPATRTLAALSTQYNPAWGLFNFARDTFGVMISLGNTPLTGQGAQGESTRLRIYKDAWNALMPMYRGARAERKGEEDASEWGRLWADFQKTGGATGFRDMLRTSGERTDLLKTVVDPDAWMETPWGKALTLGGTIKPLAGVAKRAGEALFHWISDFNLALENATRVATYKAGLDQGLSKERAASIAKNITVNFNRRGAVGHQIGAAWAFFNASVQGTARMMDAMTEMQKPGDPRSIRLTQYGKHILQGSLAIGAMQALMLAAAGFGDDEPPEFVRDRNIVIPTGWTGAGPEKGYITIPLPLGYNIIPAFGRRLTEFAMGGGKDPFKHITGIMALVFDGFNPIGSGSFLQMLAPTVLDPVVAGIENKDSFGRSIARETLDANVPAHTLSRSTATAIARWLSEGLNSISGGDDYTAGRINISPDQLDYVGAQYLGGVGREIMKVWQSTTGFSRGEDVPLYKIPLVGRLAGNAGSTSAQANAYYNNMRELDKVEKRIDGLREDGKTADAMRLQSKTGPYLLAQAKTAEREVKELRKAKAALLQKGDREAVARIEVRMTAAMRRLNEAVERQKQHAAMVS